MKRARELLSAWVLVLAAVTIWVGSYAAADARSTSPAIACCSPDCCPPDCWPGCCSDCCAETKSHTVAQRTDDCCEPACCDAEQHRSTLAEPECRSSGRCCLK
jgi:hypothetical protein